MVIGSKYMKARLPKAAMSSTVNKMTYFAWRKPCHLKCRPLRPYSSSTRAQGADPAAPHPAKEHGDDHGEQRGPIVEDRLAPADHGDERLQRVEAGEQVDRQPDGVDCFKVQYISPRNSTRAAYWTTWRMRFQLKHAFQLAADLGQRAGG